MSENIIEASWQALYDSLVYGLLRAEPWRRGSALSAHDAHRSVRRPSGSTTSRRQEPNLAPGVQMPPARLACRPSRRPVGRRSRRQLLGSPGPNVGYALDARAAAARPLRSAPHEHPDDAVAVVGRAGDEAGRLVRPGAGRSRHRRRAAALAYRRADAEFVEWRAARSTARTTTTKRRALVDAVPLEVLRLAPARSRVAPRRRARTPAPLEPDADVDLPPLARALESSESTAPLRRRRDRAERRRGRRHGRVPEGVVRGVPRLRLHPLAVSRGVRRRRRRHGHVRDAGRRGGAGVRVVVAVRVHLAAGVRADPALRERGSQEPCYPDAVAVGGMAGRSITEPVTSNPTRWAENQSASRRTSSRSSVEAVESTTTLSSGRFEDVTSHWNAGRSP